MSHARETRGFEDADTGGSIEARGAHRHSGCCDTRAADRSVAVQGKISEVSLHSFPSLVHRQLQVTPIAYRSMDLVMLTFFGSRERTLREWKNIVSRADHRFEVKFKGAASGHQCDVLDVVWQGGKRPIE